MAHDEVVALVAQRAADPARRTDNELPAPAILPKLTSAQAAESEQALAAGIPPLLKLLFQTAGNGGFGPGYGFLGLRGGAKDDQGHDAIELYRLYCSNDPEDPAWSWPRELLPLCHWGCAVYSCVDCSAENHPIVVFDPNGYDTSWEQCFIRTERNLESWLAAWAAGANLWKEVYGESG